MQTFKLSFTICNGGLHCFLCLSKCIHNDNWLVYLRPMFNCLLNELWSSKKNHLKIYSSYEVYLQFLYGMSCVHLDCFHKWSLGLYVNRTPHFQLHSNCNHIFLEWEIQRKNKTFICGGHMRCMLHSSIPIVKSNWKQLINKVNFPMN